MSEVYLHATELMVASYIGSSRNVQSTLKNSEPGHGVGKMNTWTPNIEGACGEMAVAKYLGLYWCPRVGERYSGDVGPYEVRTNMSRKWTDTCLHESDPDDRIFIGVLSFMPRFEIVGWIRGVDAKRGEWFRKGDPDRPECFYVPRSHMAPIEMLPMQGDADFSLKEFTF